MSDIRNCGQAKRKSKIVRFTYKCPKNWNTLQKTESDSVRFCDACQESVYYCADPQEVNRHAHQGHCVAISSLMSHEAMSHEAALAWDSVEEISAGMVEPPRLQKQPSSLESYCEEIGIEEIETRVYED